MNDAYEITLINRWTDLQAAADLLRLDKEAKRKAIITPEIQAQLDELDAEYNPTIEAAQANAEALAKDIKAAVAALGVTVKAGAAQAVYAKGRVSWDTKALDGYAAAHPELLGFRKEGEPSVSLRWNK